MVGQMRPDCGIYCVVDIRALDDERCDDTRKCIDLRVVDIVEVVRVPIESIKIYFVGGRIFLSPH